MDVETLKQFCCVDETKVGICRPWSEGGYTYATDGHILVRVPRVGEAEENPLAPVMSGNAAHSISAVFSKEPKQWESVPDVAYDGKPCSMCGGTMKAIVCPECDGEGQIQASTDFNYYGEHDCKTCDGNGQLSATQFQDFVKRHHFKGEPYEEGCGICHGTGKVWTKEGVMVNEAKINVKFLSLIGALPNALIGTFGPLEAVRFKFDGGDGMVMTMVPD